MSLSFVDISHIDYINPAHFPKMALSVNIIESGKCVTTLVKKNVCVKFLRHPNIPAGKAVLGRNYFSRCNNFGLHGSQLVSLTHSTTKLTK